MFLLLGTPVFKGSWLCKILTMLGANVTGYALSPNTSPNLYSMCKFPNKLNSVIGDIRNLDSLKLAFDKANPDIVFHLAAQPIVKEGYDNPAYTYETNVMGTVNILECIRLNSSVRSFLNVTTDKVYKNNEWPWGYRENDILNGSDPYANSKSCSELVTETYKNSFFHDRGIAISTARAGNVIGGGDFAEFRIIPDCFRAAEENKPLEIRNPNSTRPYQFVLEPLFAYLLIVKLQYENADFAGNYNVGPEYSDCVTTIELAQLFSKHWTIDIRTTTASEKLFKESNFFKARYL